MTHRKLVITSNRENAFAISDLLEQIDEPQFDAISLVRVSDTSWQVECYGSADIPPERLDKLLTTALDLEPGDVSVTLDDIPDIDWVAKVQSDLKPVTVGGFMIHGSHDREIARQHSCPIEIDAGPAFGTAHHGTTAGCLDALTRVLETQKPETILDLGTGSGVLAIAAAKRLPKAHIVGSDIDADSIPVAGQNARINNTPHITFVVADGLGHPAIQSTAPYELVFANILAKPLTAMAPQIVAATHETGTIIISGLLNAQARSVGEAFETSGCSVTQRIDRDEWSTLILHKHPATEGSLDANCYDHS